MKIRVLLFAFVISVVAVFYLLLWSQEKSEQELPAAPDEATPEPKPLTPADYGFKPEELSGRGDDYVYYPCEDVVIEGGSNTEQRYKTVIKEVKSIPTMNSEPALTEWGRVESSVHK